MTGSLGGDDFTYIWYVFSFPSLFFWIIFVMKYVTFTYSATAVSDNCASSPSSVFILKRALVVLCHSLQQGCDTCSFQSNISKFGMAYFNNQVYLPISVPVHLIRLMSISRWHHWEIDRVLIDCGTPTMLEAVSYGLQTAVSFILGTVSSHQKWHWWITVTDIRHGDRIR